MKSLTGAFVFLLIFAAGAAAQEKAADQATSPSSITENADFEAAPVQTQAVTTTPEEDLINQIKNELKMARSSLPSDEFIQKHSRIAKLIGDLHQLFPDSPCVAKFLPERWLSLGYLASPHSLAPGNRIDRMGKLNAEINEVLNTTTDPTLKRNAAFYQIIYRLREPIDGSAAASIAEAFVRQWPDDNLSAEMLHLASEKLETAWYMRMSIVVILAAFSVMTAFTAWKRPAKSRKWNRLAILVGLLGLAILFYVLIDSNLLFVPDIRQIDAVVPWFLRPTVVLALIQIFAENVQSLAYSKRVCIALMMASAAAVFLVVPRRRSEASILQRLPRIHRCLLGFSLTLAACLILDAGLISRQSAQLTRRIIRDYPDSFRGRLAQGHIRQQERIGKPFELEFTDAISGRAVSMKDLRGKVVVVDFWEMGCGWCVSEIPDLKRLHAKYHEQGVEFIGVNLDSPEDGRGLEKLKAFVEEKQMTWPQYYVGHDNAAILTGAAVNDFSELWGINEFPTAFLIDSKGNLYSTEARGRLETLIPQLLRKSKDPANHLSRL